ncbi:hypothetical protein J658_2505 [Acinetobacter baumannii 573719]|nr:hypothetical protein J658_2505 [Acinetobacter baumannii 573719]
MSELFNTYFYCLALPILHRIFAGTPMFYSFYSSIQLFIQLPNQTN